jgi:hypothetical protein
MTLMEFTRMAAASPPRRSAHLRAIEEAAAASNGARRPFRPAGTVTASASASASASGSASGNASRGLMNTAGKDELGAAAALSSSSQQHRSSSSAILSLGRSLNRPLSGSAVLRRSSATSSSSSSAAATPLARLALPVRDGDTGNEGGDAGLRAALDSGRSDGGNTVSQQQQHHHHLARTTDEQVTAASAASTAVGAVEKRLSSIASLGSLHRATPANSHRDDARKSGSGAQTAVRPFRGGGSVVRQSAPQSARAAAAHTRAASPQQQQLRQSQSQVRIMLRPWQLQQERFLLCPFIFFNNKSHMLESNIRKRLNILDEQCENILSPPIFSHIVFV